MSRFYLTITTILIKKRQYILPFFASCLLVEHQTLRKAGLYVTNKEGTQTTVTGCLLEAALLQSILFDIRCFQRTNVFLSCVGSKSKLIWEIKVRTLKRLLGIFLGWISCPCLHFDLPKYCKNLVDTRSYWSRYV